MLSSLTSAPVSHKLTSDLSIWEHTARSTTPPDGCQVGELRNGPYCQPRFPVDVQNLMEIESDEALTKSWNTLMFNTPQTANKLVDPHLDETDQVARPPMLQSHRPQSQYPRSQSLEEKALLRPTVLPLAGREGLWERPMANALAGMDGVFQMTGFGKVSKLGWSNDHCW